MIRSRRNFMLSWRCASVETGAVLSGYFAWMHAMICGPVGRAQLPPLPGGGFCGGGCVGGGAAGVRNVWTPLQPLVVSPSLARTRQKKDELAARFAAVNDVCPEPSPTTVAATRWPN